MALYKLDYYSAKNISVFCSIQLTLTIPTASASKVTT